MALTPGPNPPAEINVLVHATSGSRYHYWIQKDSDTLTLSRTAEAPLPAAYGIIPATHHIDAEPLDVFVLTSEPPLPGSVIPARPVGLVRLEGGGKLDDKIIAVCSLDREYEDIADISDVPKRVVNQLTSALKEGWVAKISWFGADKARKAIERAIELAKKELG